MGPARRRILSAIVGSGSGALREHDGPRSTGSVGPRLATTLAASSVCVMAAAGGIGLLVQLYLKDRGAAPIVISLVASLDAVGLLVGSLAWGAVSDRLRRRPLLVLAVLGVAVTLGVLSLLPSAGVVLPLSFLRAFVRTGFVAMAMAVVSAASVSRRRGRNLSYLSSARALGFGLGSVGVGFALESLGFRGSFLALLALPAAGIVFVLLAPVGAGRRAQDRTVAWRLAMRAGLTDLYVGAILRQMAIHGTFSLIFVYMASRGIPPGLMGVLAAVNMGTQTLAMMVFGRLADRLGRRRVFLLGFALSAVVPLAFAVAAAPWQMALGYVTLGLSFSALYIGSTAHIGDRVPEARQGTMLGLYESARGLGGVVGPILAGAITPAVGYRGMFLTMGGIALVALAVVALRRTRCGAVPSEEAVA